jgi:hypothetical protein
MTQFSCAPVQETICRKYVKDFVERNEHGASLLALYLVHPNRLDDFTLNLFRRTQSVDDISSRVGSRRRPRRMFRA